MGNKNYYRGYNTKRKRWFCGSYFEHIKREPCPLNDELRPEDIEHLIVFDQTADWNLPNQIMSITVEKESVGQAIGLSDRNSRVIFEGDYLIVHDEKLEPTNLFKVIYNQKTCSFVLRNLYDNSLKPIDSWVTRISEVLGNSFIDYKDFESEINCKLEAEV